MKVSIPSKDFTTEGGEERGGRGERGEKKKNSRVVGRMTHAIGEVHPVYQDLLGRSSRSRGAGQRKRKEKKECHLSSLEFNPQA